MARDGVEVTGTPAGDTPDAVAESWMEPKSRSVWVIVWMPVQVVDAPGANDDTGQVTVTGVDGAVAVSVTESEVSVTLPVLVTRKEYVTCCPTVEYTVGDAVLPIVTAAVGVAVTVADDGVELTLAPAGDVPEAVAVSTIEPLSTSA